MRVLVHNNNNVKHLLQYSIIAITSIPTTAPTTTSTYTTSTTSYSETSVSSFDGFPSVGIFIFLTSHFHSNTFFHFFYYSTFCSRIFFQRWSDVSGMPKNVWSWSRQTLWYLQKLWWVHSLEMCCCLFESPHIHRVYSTPHSMAFLFFLFFYIFIVF